MAPSVGVSFGARKQCSVKPSPGATTRPRPQCNNPPSSRRTKASAVAVGESQATSVLAGATVCVMRACSCIRDESCLSLTLICCQLMCAVYIVAALTRQHQLSPHEVFIVFLLPRCLSGMFMVRGSGQHRLSNPVRSSIVAASIVLNSAIICSRM